MPAEVMVVAPDEGENAAAVGMATGMVVVSRRLAIDEHYGMKASGEKDTYLEESSASTISRK